MRLKSLGYLLSLFLIFSLGYFTARLNLLPDFKLLQNSLGISEPQSECSASSLDFSILTTIYNLLQKHYLKNQNLETAKLIFGAAKGLVAAIGDPYTTFFDPNQNAQFKEDLAGTYEGIGAQLGFKDQKLVIVAPLSDSPAQAAGVKPGDIILTIDKKSTQGMSLPEAVSLIRGQAGSSVTLGLARQGISPETQTFDIIIQRQKINAPSILVDWVGANKNIAHLKVLRFGDDTKKTWDETVMSIGRISPVGLILDLRNNPGGYLDAAIYLASEFLKDGTVTIKEGADGKKEEFKVDHRGKLIETGVVILVNEGSASASEILAGALQTRGRAKLVGQKSFGKGTVQEAFELSVGAGVHITTARWLLPNGENIDGVGIVPDHEIQNTEESQMLGQDLQLDKAVELLQTIIDVHL